MRKYRQKPVIIEAIQFTTENVGKIREVLGEWLIYEKHYPNSDDICALVIDTPEGPMTGTLGDWLVKGVKGEFYFCEDDVFQMTYDLAE